MEIYTVRMYLWMCKIGEDKDLGGGTYKHEVSFRRDEIV